MDTIFKRKIYAEMLDWKMESAGESALLIASARFFTLHFSLFTKEW